MKDLGPEASGVIAGGFVITGFAPQFRLFVDIDPRRRTPDWGALRGSIGPNRSQILALALPSRVSLR